MSTSKIAVGIDFSAESAIAAGEALGVARHLGAELDLVHVSPPVELPGLEGGTAASARALEQVRSYLAEANVRDREKLDELRKALAGSGVPVIQAVIEGDPDSGLCMAAQELGAGLLVVGTHGHTGLKWFFLGSVAQRVIRMADRDVLVSRNREAAPAGYRRILVGTDFSPSSRRALERAVALAAPDATIDVVHFYHHAPHAQLYDAVRAAVGADLDEAVMADLAAAGQSFIGQRRTAGRPTVRFYAVAEAPIPGLIHWLERQPFDLVALGSHGRRGVRRFLLGSVAEAVARRAPCSALIAHGEPDGAP